MAAYATLPALILATFPPFAAFLLIMIFTRSRPGLSAKLSIGAVGVSFACSALLLGLHWKMAGPVEFSTRLLASSGVDIPFGFLADQLSLWMLMIVASICLLVQIYSLGYMAGDPGFSRYYAFMSLFAWAMLSLTVSPTILQLYVFWELVGLSSYLLIGFWYEKFSATQAGKKAFVMTRAGDVAFFIGLLVILMHMGNLGILELNGPATAERVPPEILTLSALLIFGGIVGKSAQFPLLTWLPDAMEGPTPVSALLHSATMVAAGVYLFARLFPFFSLSPTAMSVFLAVGAISMLLASTMAMVSRDIKQVWAYSTISQLGLMIMALAAGGYFAGVFHLTTHAGFKALLFLCSGVFIHYYGTNDIFDLGRSGCKRLKVPTISIVIAAAALSGFPPLSGGISKEAVLGALAGLPNPVWLAAGLLGVFLTAYYTFRVIFALLFPQGGEAAAETGHGAALPTGPGPDPDPRQPISGHDAHDWAMALPLIILASVTVLLGFLEGPLKDFLAGRIVIDVSEREGLAWAHTAALGLAAFGVLLAYLEFGRPGAKQIGFVERVPPLYRLFSERWYIDHAYRWIVDRVLDRGISWLCWKNDDKVIDGSIDELCRGTVESGRITAVLQTGMIQYRMLAIFAVMVFLALCFFFREI
ncbi:MAG: NADH-quinone oxidoreductase subunit L [Syntrophobacteraceae bacterium]